ncbi:hypothetical protein V5T82_04140 [Magnetovibrio sp. PR-2]|uniref:hypothetical protein n=1 Tax=Magnetovibrio sp. PR-2 TaxID=3120356 RepID=UPI002FCE01DE
MNPNLFFIDFEASSFDGYPIEVGIAKLHPMGTIMHEAYWIRPTGEWMLKHEWDPVATKEHGLNLNIIMDHSQNPDWVCKGLNNHFDDNVVFCRSLKHDGRWLSMLYKAAGMECPFKIVEYQHLLDKFGVNAYEHTKIINVAVDFLTENGEEVGNRYRPSAIMMAAEVKFARKWMA